MNLKGISVTLAVLPLSLSLSPQLGGVVPTAQASGPRQIHILDNLQVTPSTSPDADWQTCAPGRPVLDHPVSIVLDRAGTMYVGNDNQADQHVEKLSADCRPVLAWNQGSFGTPNGIAIDQRGNVVVTASKRRSSNQLSAYSPRGKEIRDWNLFADGLSISAGGAMYTAWTESNSVSKVLPNGKVVAVGKCCKVGSLPGQFALTGSRPVGLAVDKQGNVYVTDAGNDRIQELSPSGTPLAQWGTTGVGVGQFDNPTGIALDAQGDIFVADTGNDRIQELSPTGQPLATWGGFGFTPGKFWSPAAVAVDSAGTLYVADTGNDRIQTLSPAARMQPPPTPSTTPTTAGPPPTSGAEVLFTSIGAMRAVGTIHMEATLTDRVGSTTSTATLSGDCGLDRVRLEDDVITGGQRRAVQIVSAGTGTWSRTSTPAGTWTPWQRVEGDELFIVSLLFEMVCPQIVVRGLDLPGDLPYKQLTAVTAGTAGTVPQWHLSATVKRSGTKTRDDLYVSQETGLWARRVTTETTKSTGEVLTLTADYSGYNEPLNIQPPA